jgi:hypothetical protein
VRPLPAIAVTMRHAGIGRWSPLPPHRPMSPPNVNSTPSKRRPDPRSPCPRAPQRPKVRVHPQRDVRARMAHLPRDEHDVQALRDQQRASGASLPAATPEAKARPLAALEWVRVKQPVHHPRRGRRCAPLPTPSNRGDVRALYPLLAFRAVDVAVVRVATRQERRAAPTTRSGAGDLHVRTRDGLMPYRLRVRGVRNFRGVDG